MEMTATWPMWFLPTGSHSLMEETDVPRLIGTEIPCQKSPAGAGGNASVNDKTGCQICRSQPWERWYEECQAAGAGREGAGEMEMYTGPMSITINSGRL